MQNLHICAFVRRNWISCVWKTSQLESWTLNWLNTEKTSETTKQRRKKQSIVVSLPFRTCLFVFSIVYFVSRRMNEVRTAAADFGIERIASHPCGFVLILSIETNAHTFAQRQQLAPNETIDCIAHISSPCSYTKPCQHSSKARNEYIRKRTNDTNSRLTRAQSLFSSEFRSDENISVVNLSLTG